MSATRAAKVEAREPGFFDQAFVHLGAGAVKDRVGLVCAANAHLGFVVGQAPWAIDRLRHLPAMAGKQAVAFCTYALNPGKSLDVMTRELEMRGAEVVGGLALQRGHLAEHAEEFAIRLVDSVPTR